MLDHYKGVSTSADDLTVSSRMSGSCRSRGEGRGRTLVLFGLLLFLLKVVVDPDTGSNKDQSCLPVKDLSKATEHQPPSYRIQMLTRARPYTDEAAVLHLALILDPGKLLLPWR
jgi:hypothetical protein